MKTNTKFLVHIGILTALSSVLMMFPQFPVFPAFPWLKFDLADVPALLAAVSVSPLAGALIVVIRNILHILITPDPIFASEIGNLLMNIVFVTGAGLMAKYLFKNTLMKKKLLFVMPVASVLQVTMSVLVNLFVMIPLYSNFVNFEEIGISHYIFAGVIPFNLIRDVVVSVVFYLIYRYIYPYIRKEMY